MSEPDFVNVPPGSRLRPDVPLGQLKLAVARALDAPLARLVIGQALIAVAYLLHAADLNTIDGGTLDERVETIVIDGVTL